MPDSRPIPIPASCHVQARQLSRRYAGRVILRDVDCELRGGEIVALTGANGAGKTTLLGCLAGIVRPDAGAIRWCGRPAGGDVAQRRLVGLVTHEPPWYPQLTIRENLLFTARMCGIPHAPRYVQDRLPALGLAECADCFPERLSQGTRQRCAIARALLHDPAIVLLDEPFVSLDTTGRDWLTGLLHDQRCRGRAVCFATHEIQQLPLRADRVFHLQDGTLREIAPALTDIRPAVAA